MIIEIEKEIKELNSFPNKRGDASQGTDTWYTASQPALMFKDGSKYPDKFSINLAFSTKESDSDKAQPHPPGKYQLSEEAFYIDNNGRPACNFSRIEPLNVTALAKAS